MKKYETIKPETARVLFIFSDRVSFGSLIVINGSFIGRLIIIAFSGRLYAKVGVRGGYDLL